MAAVPSNVVENGKRNSSEHRGPTSHGRGGAGNFGTSKADVEPVNLETPTIKSDVYTTGRGGSGNMAKNSDPEEARRAQDVTALPRHDNNQNQHVGRGGAANVFKPAKEEQDASKKDTNGAVENNHKESKPESKGVKGLAEKGKEFLFGKK